MTKVDIVSGFLGAGKTTFIKQLISEVFKGEQIVLIENEFGEIGIDGGFMKDAGVQINELNSGCICCTLVGDFTKAMKQVIHDYAPDRVIIEPSGVGKLSDIVKAIERVKKEADIEITGRITVVDGKKAKLYMKNFGEFFKDQVAHASTIVISRTQLMDDEQVEEVVHMLRDENPDATIISTPWDQLSKEAIERALDHGTELESLLEEKYAPAYETTQEDLEEEAEEEEEHEHEHDHDHDHEHDHEHEHDHDHEHDEDGEHEHHHHHHHHHHDGHDADEVFTSWGKETAHKYTDAELDQIVESLSTGDGYGTILRAKGIINMADGSWKQFDLVPEEAEVRDGEPDYTGRVCVIGTELNEKKLAELFHI